MMVRVDVGKRKVCDMAGSVLKSLSPLAGQLLGMCDD